MTRAFRREVAEAELSDFVSIFDQAKRETGNFEAAIKEAMAAVLVSPHFLYIVEKRRDESKAEGLNDFEMAARLSYFLWSTMPDEELLETGSTGENSEATQSCCVNKLIECLVTLARTVLFRTLQSNGSIWELWIEWP